MAFAVKTNNFEGPLEVLLDLIEKRKLLVNEVTLAQVADNYIEYTKNLADYPLAETAHFILIASTLLLIKSRSLLPALMLSPEEEASIEDLETRLRLYQKTHFLSRELLQIFNTAYLTEPAERVMGESVFAPDGKTTVERIKTAIETLLMNLPRPERLAEKIVEKVVSLEEMINDLVKRVEGALALSFREFSRMGTAGRRDIIVSFLAMLELVKQGIIAVEQRGSYDDITMEKRAIGLPSYESR